MRPLGRGTSAPEDDGTELAEIPRPKMVRTISSMEEKVLVDLIQRVPSSRTLLRPRGNDQMDELTPTQEYDKMKSPLARESSLARLRLGSIDEKQQIPEEALVQGLALNDPPAEAKSDRAAAMVHTPAQSNLADDEVDDNVNNHFWLQSSERPESSMSLGRQCSFGKLLADLPKEGEASVRSLYGSANMDESNYDFEMEEGESIALEQLAKVTDQMSQLNEDGSGLGNMSYLTDIVESGDDEEEGSEGASDASPSPVNQTAGPTSASTLASEMNSRNADTVSAAREQNANSERTVPVPRPVSLGNMSNDPMQGKMVRRNTCGTLVRFNSRSVLVVLVLDCFSPAIVLKPSFYAVRGEYDGKPRY